MSAPRLLEDRAWCEAMLPRVSRTFALNIRLLARPLRGAVSVGYLLCRTADTLEDSWPGPPGEIRARFRLLLDSVAGDETAAAALAVAAAGYRGTHAERGSAAWVAARGSAELDLLAGLPRAWRVWRALPESDRERIAECLRTMAPGMCRYAARAAARAPGAPYLDSEAELRDYCWVVAGCVGVMLTRLFESGAGGEPVASERRLELAPTVGEALQLTNILLDWPADMRQGRCFVPADWLAEQGLTPRELTGPVRPGADQLARRLEARARAALARVPDYLDLVPPRALRYRLFVLLPALWALASLEHARTDPEFPHGPRRPRLPRPRLWREAAGGLLGHRGAALARLRAAAPSPGA